VFLDDSAKPSNAIANGREIKTRKAKDEFEFRACVRGELKSPAGCVVVPIEVTDPMAPGVISLPHGWGHDLPGVRLSVATQRPGVNANLLIDDRTVDIPSGTSVLSGVPVELTRA
jgi:hypothetical protein